MIDYPIEIWVNGECVIVKRLEPDDLTEVIKAINELLNN